MTQKPKDTTDLSQMVRMECFKWQAKKQTLEETIDNICQHMKTG